MSGQPAVSVLMPTYRQRAFIRRALESLMGQTFTDWELVLVDDGSPDGTVEWIGDFLDDPRIRLLRNARNTGLGAVLNRAAEHARGRYLAYLPSDDVYHEDHLELLVRSLEQDPECDLVYGGVQKGHSAISSDDRDWLRAATLLGDEVVGREAEVLAERRPVAWDDTFKSRNILALVQVLHRRTPRAQLRWPERDEIVSDTLEADHWRELLARGAVFRYAGSITCQWTQHPYQRHRIIGGRPNAFGRMSGGLAMYRSYYGVGKGEYLNWRPAQGFRVDELARSARVLGDVAAPGDAGAAGAAPEPAAEAGGDALRILIAGDLGFNPERLLVLERHGHRLAGLWSPEPELWTVTGPFPWGRIEDIVFEGDWREKVRRFAPDVVFAGHNWQSLPLAHALLDSGIEAPLVFHFKEGPGYAYRAGLWPALVDLMTRSAGRVFPNELYRTWFRQVTGARAGSDAAAELLLDGDMPVRAWFTDELRPKLSAADGEIHTVCTGRWLFKADWEELAALGVHVHLYGETFHDLAYDDIPGGLHTGYLHLHPAVPPDRWGAELSQYDAGWAHVFESSNGGDLRAATWSDLNLPGRLATYAAAGLPWILYDNTANGSVTAVEALAERLGVKIGFRTTAELAAKLKDCDEIARAGARMLEHRDEFTFDAHADRFVAYLRGVVQAHRARQGGVR